MVHACSLLRVLKLTCDLQVVQLVGGGSFLVTRTRTLGLAHYGVGKKNLTE